MLLNLVWNCLLEHSLLHCKGKYVISHSYTSPIQCFLLLHCDCQNKANLTESRKFIDESHITVTEHIPFQTQLMVLTRKSKSSITNSIEVCLEGTPLQKRDSVRYLGIEVDNELSWKPHIHNLHRQCMARLAQIRKSCYHLPCKARKLLYLAFVLPQLDYCSVVWGSKP